MERQQAFRKLQEIYDDLTARQGELNPVCRKSGDCCRLDRYGHQLWLSCLELEYLKEHPGIPGEPGNPGKGDCPLLHNHLCMAWESRPLGCRIFFCDRDYVPAMDDLDEEFHRRIRELHDLAGIPYRFSRFTPSDLPVRP